MRDYEWRGFHKNYLTCPLGGRSGTRLTVVWQLLYVIALHQMRSRAEAQRPTHIKFAPWQPLRTTAVADAMVTCAPQPAHPESSAAFVDAIPFPSPRALTRRLHSLSAAAADRSQA